MAIEALEAARNSICCAFGVLPSLFASNAEGPQTREAQRHLCGYVLAPICAIVAEEASRKLGVEVEIDVIRPTQSFDASGRARALLTVVEAMAKAKEAGLAPGDVAAATLLLNWGPGELAP